MSELQLRARQSATPWHNNIVLVQLLGLSPLLAISTTAVNGAALGTMTAVVLLCASLTVSLARHVIRPDWRFVFFLFVLAVFTTLLDIVLQRFFFPLHRELGLYVPLICCNMALLLHLEIRANTQSTAPALMSALPVACGYLLVLTAFSAVRELLISGQLGVNWMLLTPQASLSAAASTDTAPELFRFARLLPAAFILLGLLLALRNVLFGSPSIAAVVSEEIPAPAPRARVTGKIQAS